MRPDIDREIQGEPGPDKIVVTYWVATGRWYWPPSWFSGYYERRYE